jgi:hypothetical protein
LFPSLGPKSDLVGGGSIFYRNIGALVSGYIASSLKREISFNYKLSDKFHPLTYCFTAS